MTKVGLDLDGWLAITFAHDELPQAILIRKHFLSNPNNREENTDMQMEKADSLKEELMASDPEFRELAREHGRYEQRLSELSALTYPSDEEQVEEVTLKKKKLALKDQMYSLMLQHEKVASTEH